MVAKEVRSKSAKAAAIKLNIDLFNRLVEEFNALFPDRDSALAELKRRLGDKASRCRYCGEKLRDKPGRRDLDCEDCHGKNWVTADSPFENMKTLIRAWLAALWLRERGAVLTSPRFATAFNCSISAAQNILKKHGLAILKTMERGLENEIVSLPSAEFLEIYSKRSRETPRRQHPLTEQVQAEQELKTEQELKREQEELKKDQAQQARDEQDRITPEDSKAIQCSPEPQYIDSMNDESLLSMLSDEEMGVLRLLDETAPKRSEQLMIASSLDLSRFNYAVSILEIEGRVKRLPGDTYVKIPVEKKRPSATICGVVSFRKVLDDFIEHIKTFSHGISRKTVQLYFAIFWYYRHRQQLPEFWLFKTLVACGAISDRKLMGFVSPLNIEYWTISLPAPAS